jgi:hypothetical protein
VDFSLDRATEILDRTPATLRSMLAGVHDFWIRGREGPETFSPVDVVGHLIDGEETEQLELRGEHPSLGPVTLRQLLATWVVHDLGHIAQVARVMAKQYTDEVGPWVQYLPVLTDHLTPRS